MEAILIPLAALMIPIIIVPTALGLKHARFLREVEHAERMRAMELGQTLAEDESWSPANIAVAIGAGVPIGSLGIAWLASKSLGFAPIGPIWNAAGMVGLAGVICGSILAANLFSARDRATVAPAQDRKPTFDPDTFDVVGSRG